MAAVGGRVLSGKNRGRIAGGRMTADGKVFYEGLPKDFGEVRTNSRYLTAPHCLPGQISGF